MKELKVLYKKVDGAHFFVSNDEKTLGLCVAHKDAKTAYEAVAKQLTILLQENYGEAAEVSPALSWAAFERWLAPPKGPGFLSRMASRIRWAINHAVL